MPDPQRLARERLGIALVALGAVAWASFLAVPGAGMAAAVVAGLAGAAALAVGLALVVSLLRDSRGERDPFDDREV